MIDFDSRDAEQEMRRLADLAKLAHDNAPRSASNPDAPWMSVVRTVLCNHENRDPKQAVVIIGKGLIAPAFLTSRKPDPPVAHEGECAHCRGDGVIDEGDTYMPGLGMVAYPRPCLVCDGTGRALVDASGVCAELCCSQFPWNARVGSDRAEPCASRYAAHTGVVTCILVGPHLAHISEKGNRPGTLGGFTWYDRHAIPEPCASRTVPAAGGVVTCALTGSHSVHLSAPPASDADPARTAWTDRQAIPEGEAS